MPTIVKEVNVMTIDKTDKPQFKLLPRKEDVSLTNPNGGKPMSDNTQSKQPLQLLPKEDATPAPSSKDLRSIKQMAEEFETTPHTVLEHCQALGLEPAVPSEVTSKGKTPALYSEEAYLKLKSQRMGAAAHSLARQRKHVNALSTEEKSTVMHDYIAQLSEDESKESTEAMLANAVGFMAMLKDRLEKVHTRNEALEAQVETLECKLDESEAWFSLEKFNEMHQLGKSCQQLSAISRRLGKLGFHRKQMVSNNHHNHPYFIYLFDDLQRDFEGDNLAGW